jgi:hypothetical protein
MPEQLLLQSLNFDWVGILQLSRFSEQGFDTVHVICGRAKH